MVNEIPHIESFVVNIDSVFQLQVQRYITDGESVCLDMLPFKVAGAIHNYINQEGTPNSVSLRETFSFYSIKRHCFTLMNYSKRLNEWEVFICI